MQHMHTHYPPLSVGHHWVQGELVKLHCPHCVGHSALKHCFKKELLQNSSAVNANTFRLVIEGFEHKWIIHTCLQITPHLSRLLMKSTQISSACAIWGFQSCLSPHVFNFYNLQLCPPYSHSWHKWSKIVQHINHVYWTTQSSTCARSLQRQLLMLIWSCTATHSAPWWGHPYVQGLFFPIWIKIREYENWKKWWNYRCTGLLLKLCLYFFS